MPGCTWSLQPPCRGQLRWSFNVRVAKEAIKTVREWGGDPAPLLRQEGLDARLFDEADTIPLRALARLMLICAERADCPHFGVIVGGKVAISGLGSLEPLLESCQTLGATLRQLMAHAGRERGTIFVIEEDSAVALLSFLPYATQRA